MAPSAPSEERYLLALARAFLHGTPPPQAPAQVDWDRFLLTLRHHHVTLTLGPAVDRAAAPPGIRSRLDERVRELRIRHAWIMSEVSRVLPALAEAGHRPLVLKGVALSRTAYAGRGERYFADVDILTLLEDRDAVCGALGNLGYAPATTRRPTSYYDRFHFHRILKSGPGLVIEVHWRLTKPSDWVTLDIEGLFDRSETRSLDGTPFRVPSGGDQLLHAAIQGLQSGFSDLRRVLDVALLVGDGAAADESLPGRAARSGLGTAVWLAASLAGRFLDVSIPPAWMRELEPPNGLRRALERIAMHENVFSPGRPDEILKIVRWMCAPSLSIASGDAARYLFAPRHEIEEGSMAGRGLSPALRRGAFRALRALALIQIGAGELRRLTSRNAGTGSIAGANEASGPRGPEA